MKRHYFPRLVLSVALLITAAITLVHPSALLPSAQELAPQPGVFETIDVKVVNLEAVVTEGGTPVQGLVAGDFRLLVDGEEQAIEYFTEVRGGVAVPAGAAGPGGDAPTAGGAAPSPAWVGGDPVGVSYLVFIDDYFSIARDRDQVLDALREQLGSLRPQDHMAVVAYDGSQLTMLSSWSASPPDLARVLRDAQDRPALGLQRRSEQRSFQTFSSLPSDLRFRRSRDFPGGFSADLNPEQFFYSRLLEDQVQREVLAAAATLRGFAAAPGRRVALLLAGGWPYDIPAYVAGEPARPVAEPGFLSPEELFRPLVETANLLGYSLFPVDLPGLQSSPLGRLVGSTSMHSLPGSLSAARETHVHEALRQLARETGGEALLNAQRLTPLGSVAQEVSSYYWLGFSPRRSGDDRKREVELQVLRPGLKVRSRGSFTDLSQDREVRMAMESALLFGNPPSPGPLVARLGTPEEPVGNVQRLPLTVEVPAEAVALLPEGDLFVARLELRIAALNRDGTGSEGEPIPATLGTSSPHRPLHLETEIDLRPTTETLLLALYDRISGTLLMTSLAVGR